MKNTFDQVAYKTSKLVTRKYSTSFSIGVSCLHPSMRNAIYSIYGFVRLADEIVDTFHEYDKENLLNAYEENYYTAVKQGISLNPVIHAFQQTVHQYNIDEELVHAFLKSMRSDLLKQRFDDNEIAEYIYGSAEVVGLMCLKVFVRGDQEQYLMLRPYAQRLGAAFQKINFLRDLQHDTEDLKRVYFPILRTQPLNEHTKKKIINDIYADYDEALKGIRQLPKEARLGVYTAYLYYKKLTSKLEKMKAEQLMQRRVSVPNGTKMLLLGKAYIANTLSKQTNSWLF